MTANPCDIVFFSAHPDDAEFAAGGTLLKLSKNLTVLNIILTHGEAGTYGSPQVREQEANAAARFGGYSVRLLDFKDNYIEDNAQNAHRLAQIIRDCKPRIVFAPYHTNNTYHNDGVSHPDHCALGRIALKAARFAKFKNASLQGEAHNVKQIIYYMIPRFTRPSFVVDVSDAVEDMKGLWRMHGSQMNIHKGKIELHLLNMRTATGLVNRIDYAEGFIVEEPLVLDIMHFL